MLLALLARALLFKETATTEIYTPIGRSPGLSGKVTVTGFIETVDNRTMVMSVKGADGRWRAVVSDRSKIYIDRSAQRRPNRYGTVEDCKPGHYCEIQYVGGDAAALRRRVEPGEIEWLTIRPDNRRSQAEPEDHGVARRSGSSAARQSPSEDSGGAMVIRRAPMVWAWRSGCCILRSSASSSRPSST